MPLFQSLRRRSRLFRSSSSHDFGSGKIADLRDGANGHSDASSTSIDSAHGSSTPPSSITPSAFATPGGTPGTQHKPVLFASQSASNLVSMPLSTSPSDQLKNSHRHSFVAPPTNPAPSVARPPTSPFAPNILSIADNSWVNQQVLFINGIIGERDKHMLDGTVTVTHHQDNFPAMSWPVFNSQFKALIHLSPGPNRLRFDVRSPKLPNNNSPTPQHSSFMTIHMLPAPSSPPLRLCILVGRDSNMTYDAVPERIARESNSWYMAVQKFRMAAYLWQTFTTEQMQRNKLGRRVFRFEEEWAPGSLSIKDRESGIMRNQALVHLLRSDKTVAELQALNSSDPKTVMEIIRDAHNAQFPLMTVQQQYLAVLLLDTHWDKDAKILRGDVNIAGSIDNLNMAVFGSQSLQAFPSCMEEVVTAFSDCTRTDTQYVANLNSEAGSNWEAFSNSLGHQLHQIGRMLGCHTQESGIMAHESSNLNRTFVARESFSTRTGRPGLKGYSAMDECKWHRLDCLRFRFHPCFRLPTDQPIPAEASIHYWPLDGGNMLVTSSAGIAFIELWVGGLCRTHLEYTANKHSTEQTAGPRREVMLNEADLRSRLPEALRAASTPLQVIIYANNNNELSIPDVGKVLSKASTIKLPNGKACYRSGYLGKEPVDGAEGSQSLELLLETASKEPKIMTSIKVYAGSAVDGLEFVYEGGVRQLFGRTMGSGGRPEGEAFSFDFRRGETLLGFYVYRSGAGAAMEGIEILSTLGRRSGVFGTRGYGMGVGCSLIPPRGYMIAGLSGSHSTSIDSVALLITR